MAFIANNGNVGGAAISISGVSQHDLAAGGSPQPHGGICVFLRCTVLIPIKLQLLLFVRNDLCCHCRLDDSLDLFGYHWRSHYSDTQTVPVNKESCSEVDGHCGVS